MHSWTPRGDTGVPRDDGRLSRGWSDNFVPALAPPDRMLEAGVPGCSRASCDSWYSRRAYASFRPLMQPGAVVTRKTAICRGQAFSLSTTHEARASPRSQSALDVVDPPPHPVWGQTILVGTGVHPSESASTVQFRLNRQVLPAAVPVAFLPVYSHIIIILTQRGAQGAPAFLRGLPTNGIF